MSIEHIENIRLSDDGSCIVILDQTLLPGETRYVSLYNADEMYDAIRLLRVRGAPAIGIFAAYALYVISRGLHADSYEPFLAGVANACAYLGSARPTAVNLSAQLHRMEGLVRVLEGTAIPVILDAMKAEADAIKREDTEMCLAISEHGLTLIRDGYGLLTHCNAGPLATSRYGTGLGAILLGHERGLRLSVYCDETRPLLQGARLTMYELMRAGVECTLICDNMAAVVMKEGKVNAAFVGCDRVARNGDVANKIGTSVVAIIAKHYGIPFYVFCPSSTIDRQCRTGADITIEQRGASEISEMYFERPIAPDGAACYNPAFDVTDSALITAIVTESGVSRYPYDFGNL